MKKTKINRDVVALFSLAISALFLAACSTIGTRIQKSSESEQNAFISIWNADLYGSSRRGQITLPLVESGNYNFVVDWGDGTTSRIQNFDDPEKNHKYVESGVYTIKIYGEIEGFSFHPNTRTPRTSSGDAKKLLEITQWGCLAFGNTEGNFRDAENLIISAQDSPDISKMKSFYMMFMDAKSLTTIPNIESWNTSNISDMGWMFYGAENFSSDLSNWDTSHVLNMEFLFYGARNFNGDISNWNTQSVVSLSNIFNGATNFNSDISNWNVMNVQLMPMAFSEARSFNQNLSNWNTASLINMTGIFSGASAFNSPIGQWNVSSVRDMERVFLSARSFNQDLSDWDTSNVENMESTFSFASSFNQDLSAWNFARVRNMKGFLQNCGMSSSLYDKLLIRLASSNVNSGVIFSNTLSATSVDALEAINFLISVKAWNIQDASRK